MRLTEAIVADESNARWPGAHAWEPQAERCKSWRDTLRQNHSAPEHSVSREKQLLLAALRPESRKASPVHSSGI
jgi:hypothetical protein